MLALSGFLSRRRRASCRAISRACFFPGIVIRTDKKPVLTVGSSACSLPPTRNMSPIRTTIEVRSQIDYLIRNPKNQVHSAIFLRISMNTRTVDRQAHGHIGYESLGYRTTTPSLIPTKVSRRLNMGEGCLLARPHIAKGGRVPAYVRDLRAVSPYRCLSTARKRATAFPYPCESMISISFRLR